MAGTPNAINKNPNILIVPSIKNKGTTIRSYTSSLNVNGNYQNYLAVHTKLKCPLNHTRLFCPYG